MTDLSNQQMGDLSNSNGPHSGPTSFENLMRNLNEQQQEAVFHLEGECVVNAGPGSGKTRSLTSRFARLLQVGVEPERIMCCTFTRKSAEEMENRIKKVLDQPFLDLPYIGTMHSIFLKMLYDHPDFRTLNGPPSILARTYQRLKYLRQIAKEFGDKFKELDKNTILSEISLAKNNLYTPRDMREIVQEEGRLSMPAGNGAHDIWDYYKRYEELKRENGVIDFDDMLTRTYEMFVNYPNILRTWQERFDYIMIDEFQDVNKAQWEIIKLLARPDQNLFVVGDGNQSIYAFRGSRPDFIYNFDREFPGAKVVLMNKNYRSVDEVVALANAVVRNAEYSVMEIEGVGRSGDVKWFQPHDKDDEGVMVAEAIKDLLERTDLPPEEIAVLYRTHSCSRAVETELSKRRITYQTKVNDSFFDAAVIKDMIAYLQAAMYRNPTRALNRIINKPNRYLGRTFVEAWKQVMYRQDARAKEALLADYEHDYWQRGAIELFYNLQEIEELSADPVQAIRYIRQEVGYEDWALKQADGDNQEMQRRDLLDELEHVCAGLSSIAEILKIERSVQMSKRQNEGVVLSTVHSAKGLEFDHVFFISLVKGVLPHKKATGDEGTHEERRVFYVGVTRAKNALHLSSYKFHKEYEKGELKEIPVTPSQFLKEGEEVIHGFGE